MLHLLSEAGRSFLRAFGSGLIVLLPGVLAAPNLNAAVGLGIAALVASLAAGLKAIQVFVPQLTFVALFPARFAVYALWVDSFARAAIAAFIVSIVGLLQMPTLDFGQSVIVAVVVGAITAGIRAVQALLTPGEGPNPQNGLSTPGPYRKAA